MRRLAGPSIVALALLAGVPRSGPAAPPGLPRLGAAPNFALTTHLNDRVWLTQLRGRAVVLTFTCATCGACPTVVPTLAEVARGLGEAAGGRVFFVAVTVDPRHDSAPVLRDFARAHGLSPLAWLLLTGTPAEVEVVARRFGVEARADALSEAACPVVLIDRTGTIRVRYRGPELGRLRFDLVQLLAEPAG